MKILMLCDHYPLSPRVKKVRNSILKVCPGCTVMVFAWNRENKKVTEDYVFSYNQHIGYGKKFKKMFNLFNFIRCVRVYAQKFNPDYIHAIDFEMLLSSIFIKRKASVIYEVYDIKSPKNNILKKTIKVVEIKLINKFISGMVLASPFFEYYYKESGLKSVNLITLNNKPSVTSNVSGNTGYMNKYYEKLANKLTIGFIGTIRYEHILTNLIRASMKFSHIVIIIAGNGPSYQYINKLIDENNLHDKVILTSRYESEDLSSIYESCDFIWATYPSDNLNVKYAISNKFFESIIFRKKIIVSESTMLGDYVNKLNVGFTVNPYDVTQITNLLEKLDKDDKIYNEIELKDGLFWEEEEMNLLNLYYFSK